VAESKHSRERLIDRRTPAVPGYVDEDNSGVERIEEALRDLESIARLPGFAEEAVLTIIPDFLIEKRDYRAFWQKARDLAALFKESRLPHREREELWRRYSRLCEQLKALQEREREDRETRSRRAKDEILSLLREAGRYADGARDFKDLAESRARLAKAMELMKERFLLKGDRDACWEQWREIDARVGHRRHDLTSLHYDVMRQRISEVSNAAVYGDPHEAMNQIRSLQQAIKTTDLTKEQRSLLRESLQQWWDRAVARLAERRRERERKHLEWQRQMAEKIERLESLRDKNEQIVRALEDQISDLEGKISSSWNEDWASRARGWVHEKYEKIADIRRTNTELDAKIRDIRDRVRG
jgi:hypothetical protein